MNKKWLLSLLLAGSLALCGGAFGGCDLGGAFGGNQQQTPSGGDEGDPNGGEDKPTPPAKVEVQEVSVSGPTTVKEGESITLTATVSPAAAEQGVAWSITEGTGEATVTQSGVLTGVKAGAVTVRAASTDNSRIFAKQVVTITAANTDTPTPPAKVEVEQIIIGGNDSVKAGESITLTATVLPAAAAQGVTWSVTAGTGAATITQSGVLTGTAAGTVTVKATSTDNTSKFATHTVTVTAASTDIPDPPAKVEVEQIIIGGNDSVKAGESIALTATVLPAAAAQGVTWSVTAGTGAATITQSGVLTGTAAGTVTVKATSTDNTSKFATHTVTITAASTDIPDPPAKVGVTGVTVSAATLTLKEGETSTLTATVSPANADDKSVSWSTDTPAVATVDASGKVTAVRAGTAKITVTTTDGGFTAECSVTVEKEQQQEVSEGITYSYGGLESASFEWGDANPSAAKVEYKLSAASGYTRADAQLVRAVSAGVARADVVGLKGGSSYDFKITSSTGKVMLANGIAVYAYDRSGYAHFNRSGVGAYNDDGTLKSGAVVVYVTEATKNTVTATVNGKSCTGIVSIIQNAGTTTPLDIRIIGTVGAATWTQLEYNADKRYNSANLMPIDLVVGINGKPLPQSSSELSQAKLISGGYNTLNYYPEAYNGERCDELKGLSSKASFKNGEFDSAWNNCGVSGVKNVTVEGIGEDARIFQWGFTFANCSSIEVRNLTFEDYTEDACSFEGMNTFANSISEFASKGFWVHHNTFEEGINYWDVCPEQDKHDGDGSTDIKGVAGVTFAYNQYHNCHKTGLVGGGDTQTTANVTFHHNYYNACSSRLPLARQANMHMYNNYYYKSSGTNMSIRAGAYALIENCYFYNANNAIEIKTGDGKTGAVKLINDTFEGKRYSANSRIYDGVLRTDEVTNDNRFHKTFDTDESAFYYDASAARTNVEHMMNTEDVKTVVPAVAGVQTRDKNVRLAMTGNLAVAGEVSSGDDGTVKTTYDYSYDALANVAGLADNAPLTQSNFTGANAFLTITDGCVILRNNSEKKVYCIQNTGAGMSVTFLGTGTLEIEFSSTGSSNVSRLGLLSGGKYVEASSVGSGITKVTDDDEAGAYSMKGTGKVKLVYTISAAGTYTITCPNGVTNRGARIFSIKMVDSH